LRCEGFGGSHADLRPGVRGNRAVSFARDHGTHDVADCQRGRALRFRFALSRQRVGGFAGLADAHGQRIRIDDRIAVAKFTSIVHFDWETSETLDHEFCGQTGVPARAASGQCET